MTISTTQVRAPVTVQGSSARVNAGIGVKYNFVNADTYEGAVEVTPSDEQQTLQTAGLIVPNNIVVNPIPSNYGLITWDGSTLTIS